VDPTLKFVSPEFLEVVPWQVSLVLWIILCIIQIFYLPDFVLQLTISLWWYQTSTGSSSSQVGVFLCCDHGKDRPQTTDPSSMQCASMFLWVIVLHILPTNCNWRTHKISAWRLGHHLVLLTLKISNIIFLILLTYNQAVVVSRFSYWRGLGVSS